MARVRPYQRRRVRPWLAVVVVLTVAAITTWTVVLVTTSGPSRVAPCPVPLAGPHPGEVLGDDALVAVAPVSPAATRVRVLNAGGQRGQANLVAAQLADLGFAEAAAPDNDPFFPEGDMECVGQLRFGAAGDAAAATVALVLPCTELIRDGRADDTVDVAVGTGFIDVNPPRAVRDLLDQLGAGQAPADPGQLERMRQAIC